jgi:NAD(P)-dependent dehydrogenase (short-subunit alcohol dehydrogenase family)
MIGLDDLVVLVTGGTSGIGLATATDLVRSGANVAVNARRPADEAFAELEAVAQARGRECLFVGGDVREAATSGRLVDAAMEHFGRIDAVVHSAGGGAPGRMVDLTEEAWLDAFNVHVHSTFHLFRAAHDALAAAKGSMTLLSSAAGLRGCPGTVAYQVVKASLVQLARALARDHAAEGIRVNCVAPGIIRTPFQSTMTEAARLNNLANRIPLGREGTPEQVSSLILQLIQNDFITGETMVIDGGMSMRMV